MDKKMEIQGGGLIAEPGAGFYALYSAFKADVPKKPLARRNTKRLRPVEDFLTELEQKLKLNCQSIVCTFCKAASRFGSILFETVLQICEILVRIRSGSADPYLWLMDPDQDLDQDPADFANDLQDVNKFLYNVF
jgi:hypothetical protein